MQPADREFLISLFDAAIAAADPFIVLKPVMPAKPKGQTIVIGAGKGVAQMAQAFETLWDGPLSGVVVTRYGYAAPCKHIDVIEAAHPVPDAAGGKAAQRLLSAVADLNSDDLVVTLICGGGSALLSAPPDGCTLKDEQLLNEVLLASGVPIGEMNVIRKHFSLIKGGRLAAAAYPARVVSLVVSDVPGDNPAQVASGPTVPDGMTLEDAMRIIQTRNLELPTAVLNALSEAPQPDDPRFANNEVHVIASARLSLEAAASKAESADIASVILSDSIEGEAADIGIMHAAIAREVALRNRPFKAPIVILSGGETTVTLRNRDGRGGRNTEFLLAFANAIQGQTQIAALAADTDGIDGSEDNAGAFATGETAAAMRAAGTDPRVALARNEAWDAFAAVETLFVPGPTGTNVNDFRAILVR